MHLLQALLSFRLSPDEPPADASCAIKLVPKRDQQQQQQCADDAPSSSVVAVLGSTVPGWHLFTGKAGGAGTVCSQGLTFPLSRLPPLAVSAVWEHLSDAERRHARLVQRAVRSAFGRAVGSLQVTSKGFSPTDMQQLDRTFPDLNKLELQLGPDASSSSSSGLLLQGLRKVRLRHLHTFSCDVHLKGDLLLAVARFLVHTPTLRVLLLPNQRACSPADQRVLCAVLEALPNLTHLDLGAAGSSRSGGNAISPTLFRRITKLLPHLQKLSCNAAAVPDEQLQALSQLPQLQDLSLTAAGAGAGLCAGLERLRLLRSLELEHEGLGPQLEQVLQALPELQVLALGLCPQLPDSIMDQVASLQQLLKLSLPFPIKATHLRSLAKLPQLTELLSFNSLELDVLGPAHDPLPCVSTLVTSSIDSHGKPLAALFPGLTAVCLRSCGDMEALALRGCGGGLSVLVAGDCGGLSDEGFAQFRALRGLTRLTMDNAQQLTDLSFVSVFSSTLPYLSHISLSGAPHITDTALQLLTASCRRLTSITLTSCPKLTDKTLKRLSHCEHLSSVGLKACKGFTAEGVAALAAAPQVKAVNVSGCCGVRRSTLQLTRPGVKVRVSSGKSDSRSEFGRRMSVS